MKIKLYKIYFKELLKVMHATKEEYDDFLESNDDGVDDNITLHEKI